MPLRDATARTCEYSVPALEPPQYSDDAPGHTVVQLELLVVHDGKAVSAWHDVPPVTAQYAFPRFEA